MSDYQNAVGGTVDDAVRWAAESTRLWFDTYTRIINAAATGGVTADTLARDLSTFAASGARDMARMSATWVGLGTALLQLDLAGPGAETEATEATEATGETGETP